MSIDHRSLRAKVTLSLVYQFIFMKYIKIVSNIFWANNIYKIINLKKFESKCKKDPKYAQYSSGVRV